MKTFNSADIFTVVNCKEAKKYINCLGYFSDSYYYLNLNKWQKGRLIKIDEDAINFPFITDATYNLAIAFRLFIPLSKVKEIEEKKWRPFRSFKEFSETLNKGVGSEITYRNKDYPLRIITTTIISFIEEANREDQLQIGVGTLKFSTWFKEIEIFNGKDWQPFGVLENENEV